MKETTFHCFCTGEQQMTQNIMPLFCQKNEARDQLVLLSQSRNIADHVWYDMTTNQCQVQKIQTILLLT
jgi:hypothetical protein